jgi:propionate CoA-transferase
MKVITADEAGALIKDNASLFLGGMALMGLAEEVLKGIENTSYPPGIRTW